MKALLTNSLIDQIKHFLDEDDFNRNSVVLDKLPLETVRCELKIKSDLILAGMPWFVATFRVVSSDQTLLEELLSFEGKELAKGHVIEFRLPFAVALLGERVALNLLTHASKVATTTKKFVDIAGKHNIKILDTRKTTPGIRNIEKYAVTIGGGYNHRYGQSDMWMIKDNHKNFFGNVEKAYDFFKSVHSFYAPIEAEIHSLDELQLALNKGVKHIMLDNFSPEDIKKAVKLKTKDVTFEVSGGVNLNNISTYMIDGLDAISIGALTHSPVSADLSLKYYRV